jgi:hexokinase
MASQGRSVMDDGNAPEVIQALTGFINTNTLLQLAHGFSKTYTDLARTSTEHFLVTPVTALPTGKEEGKFLAIDVGGTNLRVGCIELLGDVDAHSGRGTKEADDDKVFAKIKRSHDRDWPIGDHLKMDKAEDLFAWIADCIAEVVKEAISAGTVSPASDPSSEEEILLGITFSFPMA